MIRNSHRRRDLTTSTSTYSAHAATGEKLFSIEHPLDVNDVAFSPDGEHPVTASWDGSARIIDNSGGVVGVVGEGGGFNMTTARFSPDGRLVATAGAFEFTELGTGRVKIWDWGRGVVLSRISTDAFSVDFDPSGSRIAVADLAGRAEIWAWRAERACRYSREHRGHQRCRLQP